MLIGHIRSAAPARRPRVDALPRTDVDLLLVLLRRAAHALLDLARHRQERLLDVGCVLGRRLEEGDAEAVCELLLWSAVELSIQKRALAVVYSTTFLSVMSDLLPTSSLLTPSVA
jgi:hypothetical protein